MENIFSRSEQRLIREGFELISTDFNRPWGGFFVIDENQAQKFVTHHDTPPPKPHPPNLRRKDR